MTAPAQRSRRWWLLPSIGMAVIGLLAGAGGAALYRELAAKPGTCDAKQVSSKVLPSVVALSSSRSAITGSGVIVQADGVIVTTAHLVGTLGAQISVRLNSGESLPARVVGSDTLSDLAVLRIAKMQLPALPISWGEPISIAEPVVAAGAALDPTSTVTAGIISATNRAATTTGPDGSPVTLVDTLRVDTAIGVGNSGGALVTCDSRLIGINVATSTTQTAVDTGVAVPATTVRRVTQEMLNTGTVTHPWLGFDAIEVSAEAAARFRSQPGLLVEAVTANGPAGDVLRPNDLIVSLDGQAASGNALSLLLLRVRIGEAVDLQLLRDGQTLARTLTVTERPAH